MGWKGSPHRQRCQCVGGGGGGVAAAWDGKVPPTDSGVSVLGGGGGLQLHGMERFPPQTVVSVYTLHCRTRAARGWASCWAASTCAGPSPLRTATRGYPSPAAEKSSPLKVSGTFSVLCLVLAFSV